MQAIIDAECHHRPAFRIFMHAKPPFLMTDPNLLLTIMEYLEYDCDFIYEMAKVGNLNMLKYLDEQLTFTDDQKGHIHYYSAQNGHAHCMVFLTHIADSHCVIGNEAAQGGYLECLKLAHSQGSELNEQTCYYAMKIGNIDCLKYAFENREPHNYENWDYCCNLCAEVGDLDCLKYAHQIIKSPWKCIEVNAQACEIASRNGHIDCLKFAYENGCSEGCSFAIASKYGHLNCLEYLSSKKSESSNFELDVGQIHPNCIDFIVNLIKIKNNK